MVGVGGFAPPHSLSTAYWQVSWLGTPRENHFTRLNLHIQNLFGLEANFQPFVVTQHSSKLYSFDIVKSLEIRCNTRRTKLNFMSAA
jgi:hypothetical protein